MSGIFGYVRNRAMATNGRIEIKQILAWNRVYGRDGEEVVEEDCYGVGCALEKLSEKASKSTPVLKKDGKYAVIDAVLYNREELERLCEGGEVLSDEELLFLYIEKMGMEALKNVNGDFGGAIYKEEDHSLTLFRDHMGVRPLYYYASEREVLFSTDYRGLVSVQQVDTAINEEWLYKTVAGYWTDGIIETEFQNIFCVEPGGMIRFCFEDSKIVTEKKYYWKIGQKKIRYTSEQEYIDKLRELITDAVKRRLEVTSGLVGAELSGGLDSGVIDILINRLGRECVYYSWARSPEETEYAKDDERLVIKDICEQENIVCNYSVGGKGVDENSEMTKGMRMVFSDIKMDELPAFRYVLPPHINSLTICGASQCVRQNGARVVFSGHGGDEGISHRCNPYELFYHKEYYHFLKHIWLVTEGQKNRIWRFIKSCGKVLLLTRKSLRGVFSTSFSTPEVLNESFKKRFDEKQMPRMTFAYDPKRYIEAGGTRNRLDNAALLGACCGVRYVFPYVDYRVMDYALSIPRYMYIQGNKNRYVFREAFRDMIPESLYVRRSKQENSKDSLKSNPNWYEGFEKKKKDTVNRLDREYWEKYLDFSVIKEWEQRGKPTDEDRFHEERILYNLFLCALVENMIKKAREVNDK